MGAPSPFPNPEPDEDAAMTAAEAKKIADVQRDSLFAEDWPGMIAQVRKRIANATAAGFHAVDIPAHSIMLYHDLTGLFEHAIAKSVRPPLEKDGYTVAVSGHCVTVSWADPPPPTPPEPEFLDHPSLPPGYKYRFIDTAPGIMAIELSTPDAAVKHTWSGQECPAYAFATACCRAWGEHAHAIDPDPAY